MLDKLLTGTIAAGTLYFFAAQAHTVPQPSVDLLAYHPKPITVTGPVKLAALDAKQVLCLAENIYFEARNQSGQGMVAVANVTLNRVKSKHFPKTVCRVVFQKGKTKRGCAFSWTCDGKDHSVRDEKLWHRVRFIAEMALRKHFRDNTGHATYYHAYYVHPRWADEFHVTARIGAHIFYRPAA